MTLPSFAIRRGFVPILTGSDLSRRRLPHLCAKSARRGPVIWLTACAHGDEVGAIVVIHEVFRRLKKQPLLKGELQAFPLMNPIGFDVCARHVPLSEEDLNRSFPGASSGSLGERIADRIFQTIVQTKPALVLDLHNDWTRTIPYVLLENLPEAVRKTKVDHAQTRAAAVATLTDFPMVLEPDPLRRTLSHSLLLHGVPALTIELGESRVVNEQNVALGVRAIWSILADHALVTPWRDEITPLTLAPEAYKHVLNYTSHPLCSHSGIIRFLCRPGQFVEADKALARVEDAFGRSRETLRTPSSALVLGVADSSVAYPGAPVAALGLLPPSK